MNMKSLMFAALACLMTLGMVGCEKKGPVERAGEEVDEAVNTMKNGGKETTADKLDDAADDVRNGVDDAAKELKKN